MKPLSFTQRRQGLLSLVGAAFCLGWIGVFMRRIETTPAATIVFYRAFLTVVMLLLFVRPLRPPTLPRRWITLLGFGALQAATYLFYLTSYRYTSVANAAFLHYLAPVFVLLLAPRLLREQVRRTVLLAVIPALVGTTLLTGMTELLRGRFSPGDLLAIASALTYAGYTLLGRAIGQRTSALRMALWVHIVALPFVGGFNLLTSGSFAVALSELPYVLLLALVSTALAFVLFYRGLQVVPASQATLVMLLSPVTNALLAWLVVGEPLTLRQALGAALVVLAAYLAQRRRIKVEVPDP